MKEGQSEEEGGGDSSEEVIPPVAPSQGLVAFPWAAGRLLEGASGP